MGVFIKLLRLFSCASVKGIPQDINRQMVCSLCGAILVPGNHRVRVKPRTKPDNEMSRLLERERKGEMLGRLHARLTRKHKTETNTIVIHCYLCGQDDSYPGGDRKIKQRKQSQKAKKLSSKGVNVRSKDIKPSQRVYKEGEKYSVDSGIGESLSSVEVGVRTGSVTQSRSLTASLSSISSAGSFYDASLNSLNATPPSSALLSPITSTPKVRKRCPDAPNAPVVSPINTAVKISLKGKYTSQRGPNTQKGKTDKKNHTSGFQMLLQDQNSN